MESILTDIPPPPAGLNEAARTVWVEVCAELIPAGKLCEVDLQVLRIYCKQFDIVAECEADIAERGVTVPIVNNGGGKSIVKNPAFTAMSEAINTIYRFAPHFGLTPKTRADVQGVAKEPKKADPSKMLRAI